MGSSATKSKPKDIVKQPAEPVANEQAQRRPNQSHDSPVSTRTQDDAKERVELHGRPLDRDGSVDEGHIQGSRLDREESVDQEMIFRTPRSNRTGLLSPIEHRHVPPDSEERGIHEGKTKKKKATQRLRKQNKELENQFNFTKDESMALREQMEYYEQYIDHLEKETDDLKSRLSKIASDKLTDNNPNIADLSDVNRPTKLADRFAELYNNEWSDAYESFIGSGSRTERETIQTLLNILMTVYDQCMAMAAEDLQMLKHSILNFTGIKQMSGPLTTSMKTYKDERKKNYKSFLKRYKRQAIMETWIPEVSEQTTKVIEFVDLTIELCLLMSIQDPPLELYGECNEGAKFDKTIFSEFTQSGERYDYIVWPALFLHTNGPLLRKGIAQPKAGRRVIKRSRERPKQGQESGMGDIHDIPVQQFEPNTQCPTTSFEHGVCQAGRQTQHINADQANGSVTVNNESSAKSNIPVEEHNGDSNSRPTNEKEGLTHNNGQPKPLPRRSLQTDKPPSATNIYPSLEGDTVQSGTENALLPTSDRSNQSNIGKSFHFKGKSTDTASSSVMSHESIPEEIECDGKKRKNKNK